MQELPAAPAPTKPELNRTYNAQLVCPHCQVRGYVRTMKILWETFADCQNCKTRWSLSKSSKLR